MATLLKTCPGCHNVLPRSEFTKHRGYKDGLNCYCKTCTREKVRAYYHTHKKKRENYNRGWWLASYGLTDESYQRMLNEQGGVCKLCGRKESRKAPNRKTKRKKVCRLNIDHNHETGLVRGLLCTSCNTFLGRIEENPELVARILNYIRTDGKMVDGD